MTSGIYFIRGPDGVYVGESENIERRRKIFFNLGLDIEIIKIMPNSRAIDRRKAETECAKELQKMGENVISYHHSNYNIDAVCIYGERNGASKLTSEDVIEIRERYSTENITQRELGEEFGVSPPCIGGIVHGEWWKQIGGPIVPKRKKRRNKKRA